jgi:hypothetical protein
VRSPVRESERPATSVRSPVESEIPRWGSTILGESISERKTKARKKMQDAPPHNRCRRNPLRMLLRHIVRVLVGLVDDLF